MMRKKNRNRKARAKTNPKKAREKKKTEESFTRRCLLVSRFPRHQGASLVAHDDVGAGVDERRHGSGEALDVVLLFGGLFLQHVQAPCINTA